MQTERRESRADASAHDHLQHRRPNGGGAPRWTTRNHADERADQSARQIGKQPGGQPQPKQPVCDPAAHDRPFDETYDDSHHAIGPQLLVYARSRPDGYAPRYANVPRVPTIRG